jgi:hypothetical protein
MSRASNITVAGAAHDIETVLGGNLLRVMEEV